MDLKLALETCEILFYRPGKVRELVVEIEYAFVPHFIYIQI